MSKENEVWIWVFNGEKAATPAAVFSTKALAEEWIALHSLTGMLTGYPLDESAYDWAIRTAGFKPKSDRWKTPEAIGSFSSAYQPHEHYRDGKCPQDEPEPDAPEPAE